MDLVWDGIREAFARIFSGDAQLYSISARSLFGSGISTLFSLVIGVSLGALLALNRFRGRAFAVAAVNAGMGFPPVVVGLGVTILLWRSGPLGGLHMLYTVR